MDDDSIIQLYWNRDDAAITATSEKYGAYCTSIASNILGNSQDAEECVNDAYLSAWNAMPTHWPQKLAAFLGKLTRNLSFNRYKRDRAAKRGGGAFELVLDELGECVSGEESAEQAVEGKELAETIDKWLESVPEFKRKIFVRRYWYADGLAEIARDCAVPPGRLAKTLERMRKQLKAYLLERGFTL